MPQTCDVLVVGAGAAGLMCALTAGQRGRCVVVIDHANKAGKKILMSGGGRCNFTNLNSTPANFLSSNPRFCISALKRYSPYDFLELVERHGIEYVEKAAGQLFCADSSKAILNILLSECAAVNVDLRLQTRIDKIAPLAGGYRVHSSGGIIDAGSVVIASGGLSIPKMGASGFGYDIARQFGLEILPTRAGLVPFTLPPQLKNHFAALAGVSCDISVECNSMTFNEPMLVTHRGLSGPAMLQISSYWQPGNMLRLNLLPGYDAYDLLQAWRQTQPQAMFEKLLTQHLPKRLTQVLGELHGWDSPMQHYGNPQLETMAAALQNWSIKPAGTEGYRTAEVTLGGVDTRQISSQTFECNAIAGLFFIGEVLDVTGHLGGHNFQWAWASAVAAGQAV